jgi:hypothetical protein
MEEYRSNSNKSKEQSNELIPEKKVEKIVSGPVKSKKKNGIQKITNVFVPEDVDSVKSYILEDIIVPAVKDILLDTLKAFLGVNNRSGSKNNASSKVSYRKYYEENNQRDYGTTRTRAPYEYDDIILDSRGEAEEVLSRMDELIATYGIVSVADFYDLVGLTGNYTDNKYGWTNIRSATVVRVRDGYMIKLPRALAIN